MNISELVGKKLPEIKKLLFSETTEEAFVDAKLVDGTIVRVEPALEIGASVAVIGEDGETVPAPDGEHELESGEVVRTEGGVIVEIMTPEPVEEEAEEVEEEMASEEKFDAEGFKADILSAVSELIKSEIAAAQFAKTEKVSDIEKAVGLITDIVEKMAATPKEEPSKKVANPFNKGIDYSDMVEKMRAITKK
jgi:hypothetical protein